MIKSTMLNNVAKFVVFKKPFEDVVNSKNLIDIDTANNIKRTSEYKIHTVSQSDLMEDGWTYPEEYDSEKEGRFKRGNYSGGRWGGKYLRAPDVFFTILEKGKDKLIRLGNIADVRFGIKTGANEFFYVEDVTDNNPDLRQIDNIQSFTSIENIKKAGLKIIKPSKFKKGDMYYKLFLVEEEFLISILKSAKDSKSITIMKDELLTKLFYCHKDRNDLKHLYAGRYVDWGEITEVNKISSVKGRRNWWDIGTKSSADAIILRRIGERMPIFESNGTLADCCLFGIKRKTSEIDKTLFLSVLNSTWIRMYIELMTRQLTGAQAVADTNIYVVQEALMLKPDILNNFQIDKLKKAYDILKNRDALSIFEESGISHLYPIRKQEPRPIQDRKDIDDVIFDVIGLTEDERKEVYWSVCELVSQRTTKAKSLKK